MIPVRFGAWAGIVFGVPVALGLATILRPATARLNQTLGMIWPFSTAHCTVLSSPGCAPASSTQLDRTRLARR